MYLNELLPRYGWPQDSIPNLYNFARDNGIEIKYKTMSQLGFFRVTSAGFLIELKKLSNEPMLYERKREYYTLAHELIHWLFYVHGDGFFRQIGASSLSKKAFEDVCEMLASHLIMPPRRLHHEASKFAKAHPESMLKHLCSPDVFNVNISPMVKRISLTGVVRESNWFISVFTYDRAPNQKEKVYKWRLLPDCLSLPRGIGKAKQITIHSNSLFTNPGLRWAGLDTLRLAPTEYAVDVNCSNLSSYFDQSGSKDLFFDEIQPTYHVLNSLKESEAADDNTISISPKRIAEEKKTHRIPVANSLLKQGAYPTSQWNNKAWRLYAYSLRAKRWHIHNQAPRLLVTGLLGMVPR